MIYEFQRAMQDVGLTIDNPIANGKIQRSDCRKERKTRLVCGQGIEWQDFRLLWGLDYWREVYL